MHVIKLVFYVMFFIVFNLESKPNNGEQQKTKLVKIDPIIQCLPKGYEIVCYNGFQNELKADVNQDGILDYVLLIANGNHEAAYADATDVRIAVFEGRLDGTFALRSQTGNLTNEFIFMPISQRFQLLKKNVISVKHQSMRHDYELKFRYERKYNDYMLIGSEYNNYGSANHYGAGNVSTNFITGLRLYKVRGRTVAYLDQVMQPMSAVNASNIYSLVGG